MPSRSIAITGTGVSRGFRAAIVIASAMALGGCAQLGSIGQDGPPSLLSASEMPNTPKNLSELEKATEHWGKEFDREPRNPVKAVNYARNLKAMGQKEKAFQVLQESMIFNGTDRAVTSEFGRLAIEFDQLSAAQKTLEIADDPMRPDWRVISARGTVMAKQGNAKEAIAFFERALKLAPDQHSIVNNLGMALIMSGEAARGEEMLRRAAELKDNTRTKQNLVIALGLQGKHDEAHKIASLDAANGAGSANAEVMRQMVKTAPKPAVALASDTGWTTKTVAVGPRDKARAKPEGQVAAAVAETGAGSGIFRPSQD